ncbi:hypothetical protein BDF22DRAFT_775494 [Syncephalis plumigaleata]|nr:hypothetical protein BDF22DRAFT_775494 [Syncephalis plumigaleata]
MVKFSQLSPQAKRLVVMIVTAPIFVSTSWVLYRRVVYGEERRIRDSKSKE